LNSIITLNPGTVDASNIKGATAAGNTYQIDGLNANDASQQQLSIPVDFNVLEEVEVLTGGAPLKLAGRWEALSTPLLNLAEINIQL
jgi:outer membrane receptor protein involved in Fe transport